MKEGEKPGKFLLPHGIILLEFGPYRIFMEGNPEGIQNQRPLGIMELSVLFFFRKSTTRSYYLMNFSQEALRGAEIWHIWRQHHVIECFWKIMKSIFHMRSM